MGQAAVICSTNPRAMAGKEWAESNGEDYMFGLPGNTALDALVAETAGPKRARANPACLQP